MSDLADLAQVREEQERDEALRRAAVRRAISAAPIEVNGERLCLDCRDPIGRPRLRAAPEAVRCIECQLVHERQNRREIQ